MYPHPPRRSCGYSTMPPPQITPLVGLINVFFGLRCGPSYVLARPSFISSTADAVTLSWATEITALQPPLWLKQVAAAVNCVAEGIMCSGSVGSSYASARHSFHLHQSSPLRSNAAINYATFKCKLSGKGWESRKCRTQQLTSTQRCVLAAHF
eukprot:scaffold25986_cov77-Cyclotella_meneghiniana.AAC.1